MVNICGLYTEPVTGADPTEGLAGQLSATPSFPAISWIRVQVMPGCRFLSLCLRFVIRAVAICREDLTPWCFASSHWFVHFDLQKTQKEPETQIALRFMAQALRLRLRQDIHDGFLVTMLAENRQIFCRGCRCQPQQFLSADRTHQPSPVCLNFTTACFDLQHF